MTRWTQLGPREREILAVLRRADAPLTDPDLLDAVEKGLVDRDAETHRGTTRHRYRFDAEAARDRVLPAFADELRGVLGEAAERLARAVRTGTRRRRLRRRRRRPTTTR
jgi:hypothetical protein